MRFISVYASIWCIFFHQLQKRNMVASITQVMLYFDVFGSRQNDHSKRHYLPVDGILQRPVYLVW